MHVLHLATDSVTKGCWFLGHTHLLGRSINSSNRSSTGPAIVAAPSCAGDKLNASDNVPSRDAPKGKQTEEIATTLYAAHLMIILFRLQDASENQRLTQQVIDFPEEIPAMLLPALKLPFAARVLTRLVNIIGPMFGPGK